MKLNSTIILKTTTTITFNNTKPHLMPHTYLPVLFLKKSTTIVAVHKRTSPIRLACRNCVCRASSNRENAERKIENPYWLATNRCSCQKLMSTIRHIIRLQAMSTFLTQQQLRCNIIRNRNCKHSKHLILCNLILCNNSKPSSRCMQNRQRRRRPILANSLRTRSRPVRAAAVCAIRLVASGRSLYDAPVPIRPTQS